MNSLGITKVTKSTYMTVHCANGDVEYIGESERDWDRKPWRRWGFALRQWLRSKGFRFGVIGAPAPGQE